MLEPGRSGISKSSESTKERNQKKKGEENEIIITKQVIIGNES